MIRLIEQRQEHGGGSGAFLCDAYGGAINRVPSDATAFVHRDELFCIQQLTYFGAGSQPAALAWLREVGRKLSPYVSGQAYQGYIDPTLGSWRKAYYGANYARLMEVKQRYDPEGMLTFPQGIGA